VDSVFWADGRAQQAHLAEQGIDGDFLFVPVRAAAVAAFYDVRFRAGFYANPAADTVVGVDFYRHFCFFLSILYNNKSKDKVKYKVK
jgi:hypothetical protein